MEFYDFYTKYLGVGGFVVGFIILEHRNGWKLSLVVKIAATEIVFWNTPKKSNSALVGQTATKQT